MPLSAIRCRLNEQHFTRAIKENTVPHERKSGNLLRFGVQGMVPEAVPADLGRPIFQAAQVDKWKRPDSRSVETLSRDSPAAGGEVTQSSQDFGVKIAQASTILSRPTGLTRWLSTFQIATLTQKEAALGRFADSNLIDTVLA